MLNSIFHRIYLIALHTTAVCLRVSWIRVRSRKRDVLPSIAVFPHSPKDWPGGLERMANWKEYFEKDGVSYDVFWTLGAEDYIEFLRTKNFIRYKFHFRVLWKRFHAFRKIQSYQTVYIQREAIPLYDSRTPIIDKAIISNHPHVVYDFYDADYLGTPRVTYYVVTHAHKLTVASQFLLEKFQKLNDNVQFTRLCLPDIPHQRRARRSSITVGWMGSPGNARNLLRLQNVFKEVLHKHPEVKFSIVCRENPGLNLENMELLDMNEPEFDVESWFSKIDIGITPYFANNEITRAKTSMKSLEFWRAGISMISSPFGLSDKAVSGINCLMCTDEHAWLSALLLLIENPEFRSTIGAEGRKAFLEYHIYPVNYIALKKILMNREK